MKKKIKLIEVRSEIAAGTRGASLGIDAVKLASLNVNSDFFSRFEELEVPAENDVLFQKNEYPFAKHIDSVAIVLERTMDAVYRVRQEERNPIVLAGDHSTAAGTIMGIKKAQPEKKLGVIWIDAHADLHSPYTTPSGNMHGMPLAMVAGIDNVERQINEPSSETISYWEKIKDMGMSGPKIDPRDVVFIALRDTEEPEDYLIDKYGCLVITTEQLREMGIQKVVEASFGHLIDCENIYVSFDVDSLDTAISKGTGTPVPGGITLDEAVELNVELIKDKRVCAWEMVEVNPVLDRENAMARSAFHILDKTTDSLITHY